MMTVSLISRSRLRLGVAQRLMRGLIFITVLSGFVVIIEPAPYEFLVLLLGGAAILTGLSFDIRTLPLFLLIFVWAIGGILSLIPVIDLPLTLTYTAVSIYLQVSALLFACLMLEDTTNRLRTLRAAYILAAMIAGAHAAIQFLEIVPGIVSTSEGRGHGLFKDANVFGPFLVLALLFLIHSILHEGLKLRFLIPFMVIFSGLLVSFSRGAWGVFVLAGAIMIALMLITAPSARLKARIFILTLAGIAATAVLLVVLLSIGDIGAMFSERAAIIQRYDVGEGGRFGRQLAGIATLINHPNGLGPHGFGRTLGLDPHNVYLNAFSSYGWLGGCAYVALVLTSLFVGFRAVLVRTPWQPYLIPVFSFFAALCAEGLIIDTDHWRHWFLALGILWGLVAMTGRARASSMAREAPAFAYPAR